MTETIQKGKSIADTVKMQESWKSKLHHLFETASFSNLTTFLKKEKATGKIIFPPGNRIFAAFDYTVFQKTKVVILGQDPYHGEGQANGLAFSVSEQVKVPPSLQNIYKELKNDLGLTIPSHGNLESWAAQGVLLLNATLTVEKNKPGSHQKKGWEEFTDGVIKTLSDQKEGLIFILWGKYAQAKEELIDNKKHFILKAPHPSPYSASSGFFGCAHFSKTNKILIEMGQKPIDWQIK